MKYATYEQLETEHLVLRKFCKEDVACYYSRIGSSSDVTRYMRWEPHISVEETEKSIEKIMRRHEEGGYYTWGITLKGDDSIIGRIDLLRFDENDSSCGFAYMLGKEFWGKGYATEALRAVFEFAFEKMEIKRIDADHMSENVGSGKVMQKSGMQYIGKTTAKYEKNGVWHDADEYVITYDTWKAFNGRV